MHHVETRPVTVKLAVAAPFHLEATARVLQRRASNPVDVFAQQRYRRALSIAGSLALVEVENGGTIDEPELRLSVLGSGPSRTLLDEARRTVRRILALDSDPAPLADLGRRLPALHTTVSALRGMRPPRFPTLFESFASVVPFQQLSLESGLACLTRLVTRFGSCLRRDGRCWWAFPSPESVAGARLPQLRACGFSARKAAALRAIARTITLGELTESQLEQSSTPLALQALQQLPGIGPWSAALVLLRGLGRTDVFPPGDVAAAPSTRLLLGLAPRASLERALAPLGPLRGYLYFCTLGAALLRRGLIEPAPPRVAHRVLSSARGAGG